MGEFLGSVWWLIVSIGVLVTFLALPLSLSPIWAIFVLGFIYFTLNSIESRWGSFRTTLYVLISILFTIAFSFFSRSLSDHAAMLGSVV